MVAEYENWVLSSTRETFASGTTARCGSLTTPVIMPELIWAATWEHKSASKSKLAYRSEAAFSHRQASR